MTLPFNMRSDQNHHTSQHNQGTGRHNYVNMPSPGHGKPVIPEPDYDDDYLVPEQAPPRPPRKATVPPRQAAGAARQTTGTPRQATGAQRRSPPDHRNHPTPGSQHHAVSHCQGRLPMRSWSPNHHEKVQRFQKGTSAPEPSSVYEEIKDWHLDDKLPSHIGSSTPLATNPAPDSGSQMSQIAAAAAAAATRQSGATRTSSGSSSSQSPPVRGPQEAGVPQYPSRRSPVAGTPQSSPATRSPGASCPKPPSVSKQPLQRSASEQPLAVSDIIRAFDSKFSQAGGQAQQHGANRGRAVSLGDPGNTQMENIGIQPWFKNVERDEADRLVKNTKQEGCFLIRHSSKRDQGYPYTLTVLHNHQVFHLYIRLLPDNKHYALGFGQNEHEQLFPTVRALIQHHQNTPLVLGTVEGTVQGMVRLSGWPGKTP